MPRKTKSPPAPVVLGDGTPPKLPAQDGFNARLAARQLASRQRQRMPLDVRVVDAERALTLAERFDEDMAVVLRACFLYGLEHYEEWASNGASRSPFEPGTWERRPDSRRDPVGIAPPPPLAPHAVSHPIFQLPEYTAPSARTVTTIEESTETVFSVPGLPSGASEPTVKPNRRERQTLTPPGPRPDHIIPRERDPIAAPPITEPPTDVMSPALSKRLEEKIEESVTAPPESLPPAYQFGPPPEDARFVKVLDDVVADMAVDDEIASLL